MNTPTLSRKNDEQEDDRLNPAINHAKDLQGLEESAAKKAQEIQDIKALYDAPSISDAERTQWNTNVSSGPNKKQSGDAKGNHNKKAPSALIATILFGGTASLGALFAPAIAFVHIKEAIVNKLESISSVKNARADQIMAKRYFSTNTTCKFKINCRFSGLTTRQIERLRIQGGELLDGNGKPVTQNNITKKWNGGKTLTFTDSTGQKISVDAKSYLKTVSSSPELRRLGNSVFASRFWSFNDKIARQVRADKRLVENPKSGEEGNKKEYEKALMQATRGQNGSIDSSGPRTDANGKPLPQDPASKGINFSGDTQAIQAEAAKDVALVTAGDPVPPLAQDPAAVAIMPDSPSASPGGLKTALGFLNPADILVGLCTVYELTNITILTAKTIMLANAMRFSSQFLSTMDKSKATEASSDEVTKPMDKLQTENEYGQTFGESFAYNFVQYGTVIDQALTSSAIGNDVIRLLSEVMRTTNNALGGASTVRTGCGILTNPYVQGALVLSSFIPGGGQIGGILAKVVSKGGMAEVKKLIADQVAAMLAKAITKDGFKSAAKSAASGIWKLARSPGTAIFVAGFLLGKYAVPYAARAISGTDLANANGVQAMDAITNGFDAVNTATGLQGGLVPLHKDEYQAFNAFNKSSTATYIADMRKQSNPLDLNNPYSIGNSLASAFYGFSSHFNIFKNVGSIMSAPSAILASLNPSKLLTSSALADNTSDELSYCTDSYLQDQKIAASPFCNAHVGVPDVNYIQTKDPELDISNPMQATNQVDTNGDPIPGSDYANYKATCNDNSDAKFIGDLGEPTQHLDPSCYDENKNKSDTMKMFQTYTIDATITDAMEGDQSNDTPQAQPISAYNDPTLYTPTNNIDPTAIASATDSFLTTLTQSMVATAIPAPATTLSSVLKLACATTTPSSDLTDFGAFTAPLSQRRNSVTVEGANYNA